MSRYRRIRELREDNDKTQYEIASYIGTTAQYYGKYENGEREIPFNRAIELANYYNVTLDYIAERTNEKSIQTTVLNSDELTLVMQYRQLTERNKGKAELFVEQLFKRQSKN